jgi:two-component system CheB/CheR fusion protein
LHYASAGGLEAVTITTKLSPTTGMAFIYVQHLSPSQKYFTHLLSKVTQMKVQDIDDMGKMINVYVIPYNKEIEVVDGHIKLVPRPKTKIKFIN